MDLRLPVLTRQTGSEFLSNFGSELRAGAGDLREFVHPFVGPAGVNDSARLEAAFAKRNARIDGIAPAAVHDLDVLGRIGSGATRPEFVAVPGVDVVINDNHITRQQRSGKDVEFADSYERSVRSSRQEPGAEKPGYYTISAREEGVRALGRLSVAVVHAEHVVSPCQIT